MIVAGMLHLLCLVDSWVTLDEIVRNNGEGL